MFDISFTELMVIAVVALIVIGPEKLPKVARTFGAFVGRAQRYVAQVKEEVNREARFEELQKLQQEIGQSVSKAQGSILDVKNEINQSVTDTIDSTFNTELIEEIPKKPAPRKPRVAKPVEVKAETTAINQSQQAKPDLASLIKNQHLKTVKSREKSKA